MKVTEAADQLGVSPRRVRAMAADGRIPAHREGSAWVIEGLAPPKGRRSLSARSWQHLAKALKQRSLEGLSGQERARTAARIRQLRNAEHPSRLLIDWRPPDAPRDVFLDSLVAHAERNDDSYLKRALGRPAEYLRSSQELAYVVSSERAIRGGSRHWLAVAAGVSEDLVRDIELGRPLASPGQVRRVLRTLEVEPTALPSMALK
ncbi:helix-turn-helix domain-containing protein [Leucobacter sp. wl10]|uniref:helix-turn-helix domain-containing protein n=1 Tax=Leucobacter sp. wl10 TaxID=2304677 RepID=UPI0013C2A06F|nr:helix-turn-helix domain-containing protein [Leucobacter sp. wl10]